MKIIVFAILVNILFSCKSYQDFIEVTNIKTKKAFRIKRGDYIQCRYRLFADNQFTIGGEVKKITDSTLVYRRSYFGPIESIPISDIRNIDRVSVKRIILPSLVLGSIAGGIVVLVGPKASYDLLGGLTTVSTLLGTTYVLSLDHRHLNKNKINETVTMQVFHKDSSGKVILIPPTGFKLDIDTVNTYYRKN